MESCGIAVSAAVFFLQSVVLLFKYIPLLCHILNQIGNFLIEIVVSVSVGRCAGNHNYAAVNSVQLQHAVLQRFGKLGGIARYHLHCNRMDALCEIKAVILYSVPERFKIPASRVIEINL